MHKRKNLHLAKKMGLNAEQWILFLGAAFLIGMAKGGVKGLGMISIPLVAGVFGGKQSTGIILAVLLVADFLALPYFNNHTEWRYIWALLPGTLVGLLSGMFLGNFLDDQLFQQLIAGIILFSLILMILWERKPIDVDRLNHPVVVAIFGWLCGFTSMIGNAAGAILSVYMLAQRVPKNSFIGTQAGFFVITNILKVPVHLWYWKTLSSDTLLMGVYSIPVVALGVLSGIVIIGYIPEKTFRYFVIVITFLMAIRLLW